MDKNIDRANSLLDDHSREEKSGFKAELGSEQKDPLEFGKTDEKAAENKSKFNNDASKNS